MVAYLGYRPKNKQQHQAVKKQPRGHRGTLNFGLAGVTLKIKLELMRQVLY